MQAPLYTRNEPLLLPYFPRLFYLALCERGFGDKQIFEGMDLGADQLHDDNYRLSVAQHEQFILHMLNLTGDPHFALQLAKLDRNSATNLPMLVAAHSGNIAKAVHMIARYSKLITRVFTVQLRKEPRAPRLDLTVHVEHDKVVYFAISSLVLFLSRFFREPLDGAEIVKELHFSVQEPEGFESVQQQFPCPVLFDQPASCIHLDHQHFDRPMRRADEQTLGLLTEMAEQQLSEAESETSLVGAVKLLLVDQVASPPNLNEAAQLLGLSPRSLRRKLADVGTTYQGVLDGVRLAIAKRLLRETTTPIAAVGYELGFNNPSDFSRAFKKWAGSSPSAYRQPAK